jgi:hypothetical protein
MKAYHSQLKVLHNAIIHQESEGCISYIKAEHAEVFPVLSRLAVYSNGYHSRMVEAVRMDYPALLHYLGEPRCNAAIKAYIAATPSHYWDLNYYSTGFASFLPSVLEDKIAQSIAVVESAIVQSFWAKESQPLTAEKLAGIDETLLGESCFSLRHSATLLALDYAVDSYITALRAEGNATAPTQQKEYLLVYRPEYEVRRKPLQAIEYQLLYALQQGISFNAALQQVQEVKELERQLPYFMARWLREGFLTVS